MDRKFQSSPLTCIFHVTRPYHCSPPCHSLFYFCVSNSAALCERRQAHGDTFSCVSFHGKSTTTTTTTTRWDDENFGRLYTSRVNETTEKPKRQAPHQEKEEEKSMQQKFKNIWGKCRRNSMRLYVSVSG